MSEVEIIVTGKNFSGGAFASANADTSALRKRADELSLAMRRANLAASSAGTAAEKTMTAAAAAADKAAASAKAAADAQVQLARGVGSAEYAAKAEAVAERDAAAATEAATKAAQAAERANIAKAAAAKRAAEEDLAAARAAQAAERASIAQATAVKRAGEEQEASAAVTSRSSAVMATGLGRLQEVGKKALEGLVVGGAAVAVESVKMATDWQASMIKLTVSANESGKIVNNRLVGPIKQVSDGMLKMAGDTATSAKSLAGAMYYVESAGFHGANALKVLGAAAQGARIEQSDLTTVSQALLDVMADYHLKAGAAADTMSKIVAAAATGRVNIQDFASAFASIVPAASAAGISMADVLSTLAQMTAHGFTAQRAAQNLAQALRSLLNPTKPMQKAFDEFGVSTSELAQKLQGPEGLAQAMQYLSQAAAKAGAEGTPAYAAALKRLMGTAAGANAALTTVGANFSNTEKAYKASAAATTDAAGRVQGFSEVQKTLGFQVGQVTEKFKSWMIQLGTDLIPVLSTALGWLNKHTTVLKVLAGVIGGVLLVAIGAYTASMASAAVATIAATWPILAVVAAVGLLAAGVVYAYEHIKPFREFMQTMWKGVQVVWEEVKKHWELLLAGFMGPLVLVVAYFKTHTGEMKKIWKNVLEELQKDWKAFQKGPLKDIQNAWAQVQKFWKQHGQEIMATVRAVWAFVQLEISVAVAVIERVVGVGVTQMKSSLRTGWAFIKDDVRLVWTFLSDYIGGMMRFIRNVITTVLDVIHGRWGKVWGDLKRLASDALHDAVKTIVDLTKNFGTLLFDAGKNVVQGLINGIKSMAGALGGAVGDIASKIRNYLPFSPAKEGPLSGEGSPDKSGAKITKMLADGMTSNMAVLSDASGKVAATALSGGHRHRRHHAPPRLTINEQLGNIGHAEKHLTTHQLDAAIEKLMRQHRLTVAQLTRAMQILLVKGGHHVSISKIDGLIAEMKKQYKGLTSKEILDAAISELEKHPKLSTSQLMKDVARDLHAQTRKARGGGSGGGGSGGGGAYISDLTWRAGGVQYTIGGAGGTSAGGRAAGSTGGSTSMGSGQQMTVVFAPLHIEIDLKDSSGSYGLKELHGLRKAIRVRGGDVQKVLGQ